MDTLAYCPSTATQGKMTPRTLRAQFGDGYMQEAADGINGMLRQWELVFEPVPSKSAFGPSPTLQDLNNFFTTQGGYKKFLWTQPAPFDVEGPMQFVCTEWGFTFDQGNIRGLRAVVQQRPTT